MKIYGFFLCLISLVGCTKAHEYTFNEKISEEFLKEMNALDEFHAKYLKDSSVVSKLPSSENSPEVLAAKKLLEDCRKGWMVTSGMEISDEAMPFWKANLEYLEDIKGYAESAEMFFTNSNSNTRKSYYDSLIKDYEKLSNKPDSILAIQKVYFEKVGLEGK